MSMTLLWGDDEVVFEECQGIYTGLLGGGWVVRIKEPAPGADRQLAILTSSSSPDRGMRVSACGDTHQEALTTLRDLAISAPKQAEPGKVLVRWCERDVILTQVAKFQRIWVSPINSYFQLTAHCDEDGQWAASIESTPHIIPGLRSQQFWDNGECPRYPRADVAVNALCNALAQIFKVDTTLNATPEPPR